MALDERCCTSHVDISLQVLEMCWPQHIGEEPLKIINPEVNNAHRLRFADSEYFTVQTNILLNRL